MGRGNICVCNPYEGLYYIDNDYLDVYRRTNDTDDGAPEFAVRAKLDYSQLTDGDWVFDDDETRVNWQEDKANLVQAISDRFPSFTPCKGNVWLGHNRNIEAVLENELFHIGIADNQWSMAIMLLQKEHWHYNLNSLQKRHYQNYLDGIKTVLLGMYPEIGTYKGAWTSGTIKREDINKEVKL